jgi:hypothetical protein
MYYLEELTNKNKDKDKTMIKDVENHVENIIHTKEPIFYTTDQYKMVKLLEDNWKDIASEIPYFDINNIDKYERRNQNWITNMEKEHFYEYARNFKSDWYQGWQGKKVWFNFPIMFENIIIGDGQKLFPKTIALLKQINCNQICGFSLLLPDGSLFKHTDPTGKEFNSMAGNMLLTNNKHSNLIVWEGGSAPQRRNRKSREPKHVYRHKQGKMVIFDSTQFHSADNNDPNIRVILYIDFKTSNVVPLYKPPTDLIFYNTNHYRIVKILEEHWDIIASEIPFFDINNLSNYTERRLEKWINSPNFDFEEYIKNIKSKWYKGCEGIDINNTWYNFPLAYKDNILGEAEKICPKTISLLKKLKCKQIVGYSLLLPNSKIGKHNDITGKYYNSMAGNLLLTDNKKSNLIIYNNKEKHTYDHRQGKMVIFDSTQFHSAENNDPEVRVILYIDFKTN